MIKDNLRIICPGIFAFYLSVLVFSQCVQADPLAKLMPSSSTAEAVQKKTPPQQNKPASPADEFDRGTPRSMAKGFNDAIDSGDFKRGEEYLDLRNLPKGLSEADGVELTEKLKVVLDRTLWVDLDDISDDPRGKSGDGLPAYRDSVGTIQAGKETVDILLQRVPRGDGVYIWKLSNRTVGKIPLLYEYHGYNELEEYLNNVFPDVMIFGWHLWQWASWLVLISFSYLLVWLPTAIAASLIRRRHTDFSHAVSHYIILPLRLSLWLLSVHLVIDFLGPSDAVHRIFDAGTLMYFVITWAVVRLVDLAGLWFSEMLNKRDRNAASVLIKPIMTVFKIITVLVGLLLWLDNIGVNVGTLVASLGIGGFAIALAAQDTLKNLLGSVMILIDRPYEIGQRILVRGHDGVVEEIGLRSTKIRLLTGHQVTIPNEEMAKVDIENIGRRPHIRRRTNLYIPLDTPQDKVEQAVNIIRKNLENHECMDADFPPRVYFSDFNRDSLNLQMLIWYRSTDFWAFQDFNQRLNLAIMRDFKAAGIKFAVPSFLTYAGANGPGLPGNNPGSAMGFSET